MNSKIKIIGDYEYDPSACVGEGAFGKVYKGLNTKTREIVAIKQMDAGPIRRDQYLTKALKYETDILGKLQHPNIVRLMDFIESQNYYYLITEFCDSGDLKQYMKNYRQGAPEKEAQIIFADIVDGINVIFQQGATHRDLKPANILKNQNRYKIASMIDFGFAKVLDGTGMNLHKKWVGSQLYMAPQILGRKPYGSKCDLWSLGVMYYEILTGRPPIVGVNESEQLSYIKKYVFRPIPNISPESNKFLSKALILDEENRITFDETFAIFDQFKKLNKGAYIVVVPDIMNSKIKIIGDYEYDPSACVGEGAFGKVYKGLNTKTREIVAIKQMDAGPIRRDQYLTKALKYETDILGKLQHPNIVRLMDFIESQNYYYLITEFCDSGDLKQYMKNYRQGAPEKEAQIIFADIVDGINVIFQQGATHRDLKPANILKNQNRYKIASMIDFGFAKVLDGTGMNLHKKWVGSQLYMAPQILGRKPYGSKCDLWSLGVMYYEILTGRPPIVGVNESEQLSYIKKYVSRPIPNISSLSNEFLSKALILDEEKRITFDETFAIFDQFKKLNKGTGIVEVPNLQEQFIIMLPNNNQISQGQRIPQVNQIKQKITCFEQTLNLLIYLNKQIIKQSKYFVEFFKGDHFQLVIQYILSKLMDIKLRELLSLDEILYQSTYREDHNCILQQQDTMEKRIKIMGFKDKFTQILKQLNFENDKDEQDLFSRIHLFIQVYYISFFISKYEKDISQLTLTLQQKQNLLDFIKILKLLNKLMEILGQIQSNQYFEADALIQEECNNLHESFQNLKAVMKS